jgi:tetraacyldisaccharide 4'-kinase
MRAPEFWQAGSNSSWPRLLSPASLAWQMGALARQRFTRPTRVPVPVVCVGNLVAGGAGKTPTAIALARRLLQQGRRPHFLTRGYGGQLHGPLQVEPRRHTARQVGDEALLLAAIAPAWVARDRAAGALAAVKAGADLLLLDDGHQNPSLHKDLSIVVIDGDYGHGNGRVVPAGPLREPVAAGLARADAVVVIGEDRLPLGDLLVTARGDLPILRARLAPGAGSAAIARQKVLAFAGIGRPEKFFASLRELGCSIVFAHAFPDHHAYAPDEIMRVIEAAAAAAAFPVTTAKDWVRLGPEARRMVRSLDVDLQFADDAALDRLLARLDRA